MLGRRFHVITSPCKAVGACSALSMCFPLLSAHVLASFSLSPTFRHHLPCLLIQNTSPPAHFWFTSVCPHWSLLFPCEATPLLSSYLMHSPILPPKIPFHPSASHFLMPSLPSQYCWFYTAAFCRPITQTVTPMFCFVYHRFCKEVFPPGENTEYKFLVSLCTGLVH